MSIQKGSKLRVNLPFVDVDEAGTEEPIDLSAVAAKSVRIIRPDGTEIQSPTLEIDDAAAGLAHWEAAAGVLDQVGLWRAQGFADDYKSDEASWRVRGNP